MNNIITIDGTISKDDNSGITEDEHSKIIDSIITLLMEKGYMFGGGSELKQDG